jgi:hypothetical protein
MNDLWRSCDGYSHDVAHPCSSPPPSPLPHTILFVSLTVPVSNNPTHTQTYTTHAPRWCEVYYVSFH